MPKQVRQLNPLGLWLASELNRRNIQYRDFAKKVGISPQALSYIMRTDRQRPDTKKRWRERFEQSLICERKTASKSGGNRRTNG